MAEKSIKRLPRKWKKILKANCKLNGQILIKALKFVHNSGERRRIEIQIKPI